MRNDQIINELQRREQSKEKIDKSSSFKCMSRISSERKRSSTNKRNRPRMETRYNSNKVLDYKKTPSKSKKRTMNGSVNNSFVSNKRNSKSNLRDKESHYSREHLYSNRSKTK